MDVHCSVDKFVWIGSSLHMDLCALLGTQIQNKGEILWAYIKNFLMLDVYENMSDEDKEFMGAMMLGAKVISAFTNPLKLIGIFYGLMEKEKLAV